MIDNGFITYPDAKSVFHMWQPGHTLVREMFISLFATTLLYQVSGIVFDLAFGRQKRGNAMVSDIGAYMLVSEYDVRHIAKTVLNIARGTENKYDTDLEGQETPGHTRIEPSHKKSKASALLKLVFLLLVPFAGRVLAVLITLEQDYVVTFKEASFGPIKLGIGNSPVESFGLKPCQTLKKQFGPRDIPIAEFSLCKNRLQGFSQGSLNWPDKSENYMVVQFSLTVDSMLRLIIQRQTFNVDEVMHADIAVEKEAFRLDITTKEAEAKEHFSKAYSRLVEGCPSLNYSDILLKRMKGTPRGIWDLAAIIDCPGFTTRTLENFSRDIFQNYTLVNTPDFGVLTTENQALVDSIDHLPLLKRRGSGLSFLGTMIASLSAILVRLALKMVTNNDIHIGIEAVVKDTLRVNFWDSLLRCRRVVFYDDEEIRVEILSDPRTAESSRGEFCEFEYASRQDKLQSRNTWRSEDSSLRVED